MEIGQMIDMQPFFDAVKVVVDKHKLERPAEYRRWLWQDEEKGRSLGLNEYGCADAANILYTIGEFPRDMSEREACIAVLQGFQDADTGLFRETTHNEFHTTAHCIAALELFDARPKHALAAFAELKTKANLERFLRCLDWIHDPWHEAHKGAGLYTSLVLSGEVDVEWQDWYFQWLWDEADPETGLWRRGHEKRKYGRERAAPLFHHLAGSFHYLFVHEYAHRPLRYPERVVDSCLRIYRDRTSHAFRHACSERHAQIMANVPSDHPILLPATGSTSHSNPELGHDIGFAEIDWIYCLHRSCRQSGHRFEECRNTLMGFAAEYLQYLGEEVDVNSNDRFNDLHWLFGAVCAVAELQQALPGLIRTEKPLRLVLDRRPFI